MIQINNVSDLDSLIDILEQTQEKYVAFLSDQRINDKSGNFYEANLYISSAVLQVYFHKLITTNEEEIAKAKQVVSRVNPTFVNSVSLKNSAILVQGIQRLRQ